MPLRCAISPRPVSGRPNIVPDSDVSRAVHGAAALSPAPAMVPFALTRPSTPGRNSLIASPCASTSKLHAWLPDHDSAPRPLIRPRSA